MYRMAALTTSRVPRATVEDVGDLGILATVQIQVDDLPDVEKTMREVI